jgi:hypothetical protein
VRERYRAKRDVLLDALPLRKRERGDASFFLWLDAGRTPTRWPPVARAGVVVAPARSSAPRGTCGSRSSPRSRTAAGGAQSLACSAAFRPAQRPERRRSTAPVRELRRNSRPFAPLELGAPSTSPSNA